MKVGRKIYYELLTGDVIQEIGEREGSVRETTLDEDFEMYAKLTERVRDTIGVIKLSYGQYTEKFGRYAYHVDVENQEIIWDLTPIQIEEQVAEQSTADKILELQLSLAAVQDVIVGLMDMSMTA